MMNKHGFEFGICEKCNYCLLYTSDAADERSSVDLGGRRIIKKKKANKKKKKRITKKKKKHTRKSDKRPKP